MQITPPLQASGDQPITGRRNKLIDILKGYAIFLVVWAHTIQFFGEKLETLNQPVGKYILIFHMPLFFFVSAYVGNRILEAPLLTLIKKRFKSLVIPMLTFAILQFILSITVFYSYLPTTTPLYKAVTWELVNRIFGYYWFIYVLFFFLICGCIAYKIGSKISGNKYRNILLTMISIWLILFAIPRPDILFNKYYIYAQGFMPFFIAGWAFQKFNVLKYLSGYRLPITIVSTIALLAMIPWFQKDDFIYFQEYDLWRPGVTFAGVAAAEWKLILGGIVGTIATYFLLSYLSNVQVVAALLNRLGQFTLGIYLMQGVVFNLFAEKLTPYIGNQLLYFLLAVFITSFCYGLCIALSKNKLTAKYALGRAS